MTMQELPFWDAVDRVRERDPRYRREAYGFVVGALGVTVQSLAPERRLDPVRRHLSGRELLEGIATLARREFGFLAPTVFREWGVLAGDDIGRIVFQLVECRQLSARPEDSLDDFHGFDLAGRLAGVDGSAGAPGGTRGRVPGRPEAESGSGPESAH